MSVLGGPIVIGPGPIIGFMAIVAFVFLVGYANSHLR